MRRTGCPKSIEKSRYAKVVSVILLTMLSLSLLVSCRTTPYGSSYSWSTTGPKNYSLSERKELAKEAFVRELIRFCASHDYGKRGKFNRVDWYQTRYSATVKQVSDDKYEVTLTTVYLLDKYENVVAELIRDFTGEVYMSSDGVVSRFSIGYNLFLTESKFRWQ